VTVASMLKAAIKAGVFFTGFLASDRVIRSRIEEPPHIDGEKIHKNRDDPEWNSLAPGTNAIQSNASAMRACLGTSRPILPGGRGEGCKLAQVGGPGNPHSSTAA